MLRINEIFVSYQGEGPRTGRRSLFIRLQGCNLQCSWCDSESSIKIKGGGEYTIEELKEKIIDMAHNQFFSNVVITGGEPLLQSSKPEFVELLDWMIECNLDIEIETNGTIKPLVGSNYTHNIQYNVSPKLNHSGNKAKINTEILKCFVDLGSVFKFVVSLDDGFPLREVYAIKDRLDIDARTIWLMPEGTDSEKILYNTGRLMQTQHDFNVTTRLHILVNAK